MRRALPAVALKSVAALKAARLATSSNPTPQPTRKLKKRSLPEPSGVGNGAQTWYRPGLKGLTIVMTSVPMSPNFVDAIAVGMTGGAFPVSVPVRLLYEACVRTPGVPEL